MKSTYKTLLIGFLLVLLAVSCKDDNILESQGRACNLDEISDVKINEIQVIGSHNSYRLRTYQPILTVLQAFTSFLPEESDPLNEWEYNHVPLPEQLDEHNVRAIELDIYYDPEGGIFFNRAGLALVGEPIASGIEAYNEPGLKVLHIPDVDYRTHYVSFKDALQTLLNWSESHPGHLPVFIMLELKETEIPLPGFAKVKDFTTTAKASIPVEIREVLPEDKLFTPKEMRGDFTTLYEALQAEGWPTIEQAKGKFLFFGLGQNEIGETIFGTNSSITNNDDFVIKVIDGPESNFNRIQEAVEMGFIVRTRADSGTKEARSGDVSRRDKAVESGAQLIYTDYYQPDQRYLTDLTWTDYHFQWPLSNGKARVKSSDCYITE
ncbi:MAG: hypothetical protein KDD32_02305 [Bacteroidetes bacterium]|nr:hypothetical protein [Bacteroidota bacterium]